MVWDPRQYAVFGSHRGRPFADLLARVGSAGPVGSVGSVGSVRTADSAEPAVVVDLGCGDGPLTLGLTSRWPRARVVGVDASAEMLEAARGHGDGHRVEWVQARAETWDPASIGAPIDVLVTNATLQWVPGHLDLMPRWFDALAPGGWFAMQVPTNFGAPSHTLMREVAARHTRSADLLPRLMRAADVADPQTYLRCLVRAGLEADVWSTTYQHVLDPAGTQRSPVLEWVSSTGLRPVLEVLTDPGERQAYLDDYVAELDRAYPREAHGVVLGFSRLFAVGRKPE